MVAREKFKPYLDDNGNPTATKAFSSSVDYVDSEHINNGHPDLSDGDATIFAKVTEAGFTLSVTCALYLGLDVGYGPWRDLKDDSDTRVNTFSSSKVFVASLRNQSWWIKNHRGFKYRITRDSGNGDCTIISEGDTS